MALTRCQQRAAAKARQRAKAERMARRLEAAKNNDVQAIVRHNLANPITAEQRLHDRVWRGACPLGSHKAATMRTGKPYAIIRLPDDGSMSDRAVASFKAKVTKK